MIESSKKHLEETKESYLQHMKVSSKISFGMFVGSLMVLVHSITPALFITSASQKIKELNGLVEE